jgi:hypothetical protein
MDCETMLAQLAEVERHIERGEILIVRQQQLISELERTHRDPTEAQTLLRRAEDLQAKLSQERDRLRTDLAKYGDLTGGKHPGTSWS